MPDVHRFQVRVLGSDGGELSRFGSYGNMDDRGPEIRFGWPLAVQVSGNRAFVADLVNRRIVAVRLAK